MKESDVKNQMALVVSGISSPQLSLWRPLIQDLISEKIQVVYHLGNGLSEEDDLIIKNIGKESLTIEKFDEENLPASMKWVLFTSTADKLSHDKTKVNRFEYACFFGGMTSENLDEQAEAAIKLNINTLFSDLMPSEIRKSLSHKSFSFFVERNFFLPPSIPSETNDDHSFDEESLFIYNSHESDKLHYTSELYVKAFQQIDSFRLVDLSTSPIDEWITQCTPSKTCKKVMADVSYRPINHFLLNICSCREIDFHALGTRGALSPERTFFEKSQNSASWIRQIAPSTKPSLRQKTYSLISSDRLNSSDQDFIQNSCSKGIESTITSSLFEEEGYKPSHEFRSKIREHYSKDPEIKDDNANLQYLTSPFSFLFEDAPHCEKLKESLEFFISEPNLSESNPVFETLVGVSLRLISTKVVSTACFHALSALQAEAPLQVLNQFSLLFLEEPKRKSNLNLASYFQHNLQVLQWPEKVRALHYDQLLRLPLQPDVLSCLYLGANQLDSLQGLAQDSRKQGHKGVLGRAVYYNIHKSSELTHEQSKTYEDLCRSEIAEGTDNIFSHLSLAMLEILCSKEGKNAPSSIHKKNPKFDVTGYLVFCHELALLSLTRENLELANFFFTAQDQARVNLTAYSKLSAILISILLDKIDLAESLSQEYMEKDMESPWNENVRSVYHLALFHALLFRMTQKVNSERKAKVIMDASLIAHDPFFQKLFPRIEATEKLKADSPIFSLIERLEQELPSL